METFKISSNQSVVIEPFEIKPSSQSETSLAYNVFFKFPLTAPVNDEEKKAIPEQLISQFEYILKLANNGNVNFKCTNTNTSGNTAPQISYLHLIKIMEITDNVKEIIRHMYDSAEAFALVMTAITSNVSFDNDFTFTVSSDSNFEYIGIDTVE